MKLLFTIKLSLLTITFTFAQIGFDNHIIVDNTNATISTTSVYAADINGDGNIDILSSSLRDDKLAWYPNTDGLGTFAIQQVIDILDAPKNIYANDLDGDGDMDIFATSIGQGLVWYENTNGLGDFNEAQILVSDMDVSSAEATDLDGDGDLDLLASYSNTSKVVWFENLDGMATFGAEQLIAIEAYNVRSVIATDIDSDGFLDVVAALLGSDKILWYKNLDGQGNFGSENLLAFSLDGVNHVFSGDFDGDGDQDILASAGLDDQVIWYENDGQGNFDFGNTIANINGASSVYGADLDDDGDLDVLSTSSGKVTWYENTNGLGNFSSGTNLTSTAFLATSVFAADIDNDGDLDPMMAAGTDQLFWYKNLNGNADFDQEQTVLLDVADGVTSIFSIDIDGDNDLDLLSASEEDHKIAWYENLNGQGFFGIQKHISLKTFNANSVSGGDIDGDGDSDIVFLSPADPVIYWNKNLDGNGNSWDEMTIDLGVGRPQVVGLSDLDNDGDLDIVCAIENIAEDRVVWFENMDGQGNFSTEKLINDYVQNPNSLFFADVDGDGDTDVLTSAFTDNSINWFENTDGQGGFDSNLLSEISDDVGGATAVSAGDLDGDGDIDLLSASSWNNEIAWYENDNGTFGNAQSITTLVFGETSIAAKDIDGDGDIDVISTSFVDGKVAWYENIDGLGNFGVQQIIIEADGAIDIEVVDIDGDSDLDIIYAAKNLNQIGWNENKTLVTNEIRGTVSIDTDFDGCQTDDLKLSNMLVVAMNGFESYSTFTLENGFYQLFPPAGSFTTTVSSDLTDFYTINPLSYNSGFPAIGSIDTADFCLTSNQTINDLAVSLYPKNEPRPGFPIQYEVVYRNAGTTQTNGTVVIEFDETKMIFVEASQQPSSQTSNSISFEYTNLNLFESRKIDLDFDVFAPPIVNLDEIITTSVSINPNAGDLTPDDNTLTLNQTVIGSFDPNDIRVLEGEQVFIEDADNYLHYIIRFQNTGTASAINVVVENELDQRLDWQTMHLESYSHPNQVQILNGRNVSFIFEDINLPDSTSNEPASHGYISYKIKPIDGLMVGDIISNNAEIYFDFNAPILTNTVTTEYVEPTNIKEFDQLDFQVYPIPITNILSVKTKEIVSKIEIYNGLGTLIYQNKNQSKIDLSLLSPGLYYCKVFDLKGRSGVKKIIKNK